MLKTITTTSSSLYSLLTASEVTTATELRKGSFPKTNNVLVQNLWTQDIYVDFWTDATTTWWIKITSDDSLSFAEINYSDCNLISDGADNTNVRIVIN